MIMCEVDLLETPSAKGKVMPLQDVGSLTLLDASLGEITNPTELMRAIVKERRWSSD